MLFFVSSRCCSLVGRSLCMLRTCPPGVRATSRRVGGDSVWVLAASWVRNDCSDRIEKACPNRGAVKLHPLGHFKRGLPLVTFVGWTLQIRIRCPHHTQAGIAASTATRHGARNRRWWRKANCPRRSTSSSKARFGRNRPCEKGPEGRS